ncbi:MAG: PKD domain-containing protein [Bacteroidota bacterium]
MINRYFFLPITLLCFAFLLSGYQTFAQVTVDKTSGCAPLLVQFTGPAGTYDFGDGNPPVPTAANPGRQYLRSGTFTVKYNGASTGLTITVYEKPKPLFIITEVAGVVGTVGVATGCAPLTVKFADQSTSPASTPIISRTWYFGDGSSSTAVNPTHVYSQIGTYAVELVVKTANCQENLKKTDQVVVTEPPVLDFNVSPGASCGPVKVQFTNTSTKVGKNPQFSWEFFNKANQLITTSTLENPAIDFTEETSYTAKLTVKDASGCTSTLSKSDVIEIKNNYIEDFTFKPKKGTCNPIEVLFFSKFIKGVSNQTVDWVIMEPVTRNVLGTTSGINPPPYNFANGGTYLIKATSYGGVHNCPPISFEKEISIATGGTPDFTMTNFSGCTLPLTTSFDASASTGVVAGGYSWNFGDGQTGTGVTTSHTYTNYGTYSVTLTVADANGCSSVLTKNSTVNISQVSADFAAPLTYGCNDANGNFTVNFQDRSTSAVPISNWKWEFFTQGGVKVGEVQGSDPNVHKNPTYTFNTVNANDGRELYTVKLTVSTANGCSDPETKVSYIKVGDKPRSSFTANPYYGCPGTTVNYTYTGSTPFDSIYWFPLGYAGPRIARQGNQSPNLDYTYNVDPGTYVAGLVVWNGGCSDSTQYNLNNPIDPRFTQLAPRARATWFINNCAPDSVYFTDQSAGAQFWRWDFGSASIVNPYPSGAAIRDFLPGLVPSVVRNPVVKYPAPGPYNAILYTEADNVYYVTDPVTGVRLRNSINSPITYTTNPNEGNAPLHFGSITTADSILLIRCRSQVTVRVVVPNATAAAVAITSTYSLSNPNCFPVTVNFQNSTPGAASWYWILGNGEVSTAQNPTGVVYDKPGKYTVELVITTTNGCKFRKVFPDYVIVNGPLVNFDYCEADVCVNQNMQFKDLTTSGEGIKSRTWDMGNGVVFSNEAGVTSAAFPAGAAADLSAFSYAFPAAPTNQIDGFTVKLTVTEQSGCQGTKTVKVRPTLPEPDFTTSAITINCEEEEVTVNANTTQGFGPFRYRWKVYPKGSAVLTTSTNWSTNSEAKFKLKSTNSTTPKDYEIHLEVEDFKYVENAASSGTGCYKEKIKEYTVNPGQITVDFTWAGLPVTCPPREVEFTDLSTAAGSGQIVSWLWDFGDGTTSTIQNPKKIYTEPNSAGYKATLTVTDRNGCQQTKIGPNPIVVSGISGTFTSQQISGSLGPAPYAYPVFTAGTTIDYVAGIFTPNPYQVQFEAVVNPTDLPSIGSFIWDFGDGTIGFTTPTAPLYPKKSDIHEYASVGIFYPSLIIRSNDGCDYGAPADIYVIANECLAPTIDPVQPVCKGEMITLIGKPPVGGISPFSNPVWTNLDTRTVIPNQADPLDPDNPEYKITVPLNKATNFAFQITDGGPNGGCTSYTAIRVDIHTPPVADAGKDSTICHGANITLKATYTGGSGTNTYQWTSIPNIGTQTGANPNFALTNLVSSPTPYIFNLLITDSNGCTATDKVSVTVNPPPTVDAGLTAEICSGSSTLLQAIATGGTGNPADFTYEWTPGTSPGSVVPAPMTAIADPKAKSTLFTMTNLTATVKKYTYNINIIDKLGCIATDTVSIYVSPGLTLTYANHIICEGENVKLTGTVVGGSGKGFFKYSWRDADFSPSPTLDQDNIAAPTATPTQPVTDYILTVTEVVNGEERCGGTTTVRVNWSPPIIVKINGSLLPDPVLVCKGNNTQFTSNASGGTGVLKYQWTWEPLPAPSGFLPVDNGTVTPNFTTNVNAITTSLEYTLTVTDAIGCTGSAKIQVRIPKPLANAGLPQEFCINETSYLLGKGSNGLAPYKFQWKYESGPMPTNGVVQGLKAADVTAKVVNPEFLNTNPAGTYVYSLVVQDARGCYSENITTVSILVNPLPAPPLISGRIDYCKGETVSLSASGLPSGIFKWYTEESLNPTFQIYEGTTYETPGIYNMNFYVTQTNPVTGCVSPPSLTKVTINEIPAPPLVTQPAVYCPGDVIAPLTATGTHLRWYADIDLKILLKDNADTLVSGVPSIAGTTIFYVTQSNNTCEGPPSSVEIRVNPTPPAPKSNSPVAYCQSETVTPIAAFGEDLKWYATAKLDSVIAVGELFDTKISNSVVSSHTYYVTQTILGCVSPPTQVIVDVRPKPLKATRKTITYCFEGEVINGTVGQGKRYTLDAGPGYAAYVWEHSGDKTQTSAVTQEGIYYVNLFNDEGCSVRDSIVVTEICPPRINVPSAFTPNGDGKNDNMQVFGRHFHDLELTIYNRWGEIIYIGKNKAEPWDGYYRGELVQLGTYPWVLKAIADIDGSIIQMRGIITVIR